MEYFPIKLTSSMKILVRCPKKYVENGIQVAQKVDLNSNSLLIRRFNDTVNERSTAIFVKKHKIHLEISPYKKSRIFAHRAISIVY